MIKGEFQVTDAGLSLQPLPLHTNLEKPLSEEVTIKNTIAEKITITELDSNIYYSRLKKRRRCRPSNIL